MKIQTVRQTVMSEQGTVRLGAGTVGRKQSAREVDSKTGVTGASYFLPCRLGSAQLCRNSRNGLTFQQLAYQDRHIGESLRHRLVPRA